MSLKKVEVEYTQKDVVFMSDADIEFVSLVRHGANQSPFKVVKEEGGEKMGLVVQSICVPKNVPLPKFLSTVATDEKKGWINDAKFDAIKESDSFLKYEQLPETDFEAGSLTMMKVGEGWAIIGKLDKAAEKKHALTVPEVLTSKEMSIVNPFYETVASVTEVYSYNLSFGELFWSEVDKMTGTVYNAMTQLGATEKMRKQMVKAAVDAFSSFVSAGMDTLSAEGLEKMAKEMKDKAPKRVTEKAPSKNASKTEVENMDLFGSKEEFVQATAEIVNSIMEKRDAAIAAKAAEEASKAETVRKAEEGDKALKETQKALTDLTEQMAKVVAKVEEMGGKIVTTSGAEDVDENGAPVEKEDKGKKTVSKEYTPLTDTAFAARNPKNEERAGVFKGLFDGMQL